MLNCSVMPNSLQPHELYVACQPSLSMGILQASILEWVAMPSSRGSSSQPRDQTQVSRYYRIVLLMEFDVPLMIRLG